MTVEINTMDFAAIRRHYLARRTAHQRLRELLEAQNAEEFAELALGIANPAVNYSASEHLMGRQILTDATHQEILELGNAIEACRHVNHLPRLIYERSIKRIKISIGSELAMMLRPKRFWVGNVRTIWSHLVIKHRMNDRRANDELRLYYDFERDSEMDYSVWSHVYLEVGRDIRELGRLGGEAAETQGVRAGRLRYMWADAVAQL